MYEVALKLSDRYYDVYPYDCSDDDRKADNIGHDDIYTVIRKFVTEEEARSFVSDHIASEISNQRRPDFGIMSNLVYRKCT
jgi:hypothetical protein